MPINRNANTHMSMSKFGFPQKQTLRQRFACKSFLWELGRWLRSVVMRRGGKAASGGDVTKRISLCSVECTPGQTLEVSVGLVPQNFLPER